MKEKYDTMLRLKIKPLDWLVRWESVVARAQQFDDMSEFKHGIWLQHMATWMKPHAPEISMQLRTRSNGNTRNDISQYPSVLREQSYQGTSNAGLHVGCHL